MSVEQLNARYAAFVESRRDLSEPWELVQRFDFGEDREHFLHVEIGNKSGLQPINTVDADAFYGAYDWEPLKTFNAREANVFKVVHPEWKYVVRLARDLEARSRNYRIVWAFDSY